MKKIRKAVFPVAGFGTRFLPATKAMPKELMPIINKPLIQYAVEEAVSAGIDTLIFITGRNKRAIEDHFDRNLELEAALISKGKVEEEEMVRNILPSGVECIFVRQPKQLGLGHAILCAERVIGNEPFAVLLADDFLTYDDKSATSDLICAFEKSGKTQISTINKNGLDLSNYGVLKMNKQTGEVEGIVEKPNLKDAPSDIISIGRYILNNSVFDILRKQKPGYGGEIQLSDAINTQAKYSSVEAVPFHGHRFDCGSVKEYTSANLHMAKLRGFF